MAAETAKSEGIPVDMVIVADDVALDDTGSTGPRGIAGTVFVHKVPACLPTDEGMLVYIPPSLPPPLSL